MPDKHAKIKIRKHNPIVEIIIIVALVLIGIGSTLYAYNAGLDSGLRDKTPLYDDNRELLARLDEFNNENLRLNELIDDLEKRLEAAKTTEVALQREKEIDRVALDGVNQTLITQQERIGELTEKLAFYQAILSPTGETSGLRIQRFKIFATDDPNVYHYEITLVQALKHENQLKGSVKLSVQGLTDEKPTTLALKTISRPEINSLAYNFKYYQKFNGTISLPENFVPIRSKIVAIPRGRSADSLSVSYSWNSYNVVDSENDSQDTKQP